jgi:multidrug efflux pump subunit AcrA (membrane-fusion protein)
VGSVADVVVDGQTGTLRGTVSQVGPVQSASGTYSYPVVIALPSTVTGLFAGSTANVSILTGHAVDAVAVPTSAITTAGSVSYVEILKDGVLTRHVVKVGMVGSTFTQIRSGLTEGAEVVLADLSVPVPSSNTGSTFGGLGGGGFGGSGGFGGGGAFRQFVTPAGAKGG